MYLRRLLALPVVLALVAPAALTMSGCGSAAEEDEQSPTRRTSRVKSSSERLAQAGAWKMPASVRAKGESQHVGYDSPPAWQGGKNCTGTFTKGAAALKAHLLGKYKGISSIGGYSCRQNTANAAETSVHGTGRALDIMIPTTGGKADNTVGDEIANWLVVNAEDIGIQFIIWDQTKWNASYSSNKDKPYTGPNPHVDHLHVELDLDGAAKKTPFFTGGGNGDAAPNQDDLDPGNPPVPEANEEDNAAADESNADSAGCGNVGYEGACDGDVLKFCDAGELVSASCGQQGRVCAEEAPGSGFMVCKLQAPAPANQGNDEEEAPPPVAADPDPVPAAGGGCGNVSYEGQCSSGKLSFCDNGDLTKVDCKAKGQVCGFDLFNAYFDCL